MDSVDVRHRLAIRIPSLLIVKLATLGNTIRKVDESVSRDDSFVLTLGSSAVVQQRITQHTLVILVLAIYCYLSPFPLSDYRIQYILTFSIKSSTNGL